MKKYIGFKTVQAEFEKGYETDVNPSGEITHVPDGYKVIYSDGYESWSPKNVFEKAYMQVGDNNSITQTNVDKFIKNVEVTTLGDKTTVVRATLVNGFEIVESSSCVDKANYNEEMGKEICLECIKNKIWELLGFLLQTAINGIKEDYES